MTEKSEAATVQPTITGEQVGLWLFGAVLLHVFDDVTAAQIAAMNINAACREWVTTFPVGSAVRVDGAVSTSLFPLPGPNDLPIYVQFTTGPASDGTQYSGDEESIPATLFVHRLPTPTEGETNDE